MKEILFNICLVAVAMGLFKILAPENVFKKQLNFIISCFFIISVIYFVMNGNYDLDGLTASLGAENYYVDFTEEMDEEKRRAIAGELKIRVEEKLAEENIYPEEIYIIVNILGTNSISINEIKLVLKSEDDFVKTAEIVEREVGGGIKVTIEVTGQT